MRQAEVRYKDEVAGILRQDDEGRFRFRYYDAWFYSTDKSAISLTLPKTRQEYHSEHLFACFFNILPEGTNKEVVCYDLRIDPEDHFSLLMQTAKYDSIGALTIQRMETNATA